MNCPRIHIYFLLRMDPMVENDWLNCKNDSIEESQIIGNVIRSWQYRELGIDPRQGPQNKTVLENTAEDILIEKKLTIRV